MPGEFHGGRLFPVRANTYIRIPIVLLLSCCAFSQAPPSASPDLGKTNETGSSERAFKVGGGVTPPRAIYQPDPQYSKKARKAKLQGTCLLWLIVGADGKPRDIRVQRALGMGLDEEAIKAVKTWTFEPALKDGKPVPVQINVEVNFRLY